MRPILIALALTLAGCYSGPKQIMLTKDGQVAKCETDPWSTFKTGEANEACAAAYESQGWKRISTR